MVAELLLDARAELGEGPCWDSRTGVLRWVDIHAGTLHTYFPHTREDRVLDLGEPIGCCAPSSTGGLVVALRSGIWIIDPPNGTSTRLCVPEKIPGNRFNDGKCDPAGRFLVGSMDEAEKETSGTLYSCTLNGECTPLLDKLCIPNGMTWSPDFSTFYFIDTPTRTVTAYEYDLITGNITNPYPVVRVPEEAGWPDGMTSDSEGKLWIALWGGSSLTRWDPESGNMIASYPIPALNVSSCEFGGENLEELYITTARKGMTGEQLTQFPLSGGLFRLHPGVRGIPTFEFGRQLE